MSIIVDIDDTLLRNGTQPIQKNIDYVNGLRGSIVIVTGRPTSDRDKTIKALHDAGVRYAKLKMNPYGTSETAKFKREVAKAMKNEATLAIDNNATMRRIYAAEGIPTKDPATI